MKCSRKFTEQPWSFRNEAAIQHPPAKGKERGAILLILIVTMIVVSILGTGMLYLNTSATHSQMLANKQMKARWLVQSGIEYATPIIKAANQAGPIDSSWKGESWAWDTTYIRLFAIGCFHGYICA